MANKFYPVKAGQPIVNGPGKFDLSVSLFSKGFNLEFTVRNETGNTPVVFVPQSIEAEDGSRESWNLVGIAIDTNNGPLSSSMMIYYDSRTRKGTVTKY